MAIATNIQNSSRDTQGWPGLIHAYRQYLPVSTTTPVVTLCEGNTPLLSAPALSRKIGRGVRVWLKLEGLNPTGSFKDRGMTMAISKAKEAGSQAVICASTGNTSAAAAAYATRAKIKSFVLIPDGKIALGKLAQAMLYGAKIIAIAGNFDQALAIVRQMADHYPITLVNSVNPYRLEGQKTAAFEVVEQLGDAPDWLCIPVGNAGNITAYWMGFCQYHSLGKTSRLPQMMGFQATGAAPLVHGQPVTHPETVASAIRIGNPASWQQAIAVQQASRGQFNALSDPEILAAYRLLAAEEGIFCEPASATPVAGLLKLADQVPSGARVVCVLTGNGLKDADVALQNGDGTMQKGVTATPEAVAKAIGF